MFFNFIKLPPGVSIGLKLCFYDFSNSDIRLIYSPCCYVFYPILALLEYLSNVLILVPLIIA